MGSLFSEAARPHAPPLPDPELMMGLRRVIKAEHPDIVHAHNWLLHSFLPLKRHFNLPFVVTLHDYSLICAKKNLLHKGALCAGPQFFKCLDCARDHYGAIKGMVTNTANWIDAGVERRAVDMFLAVSNAVARLNRLPESGVPYKIVHNFVPDDISALHPNPDQDLLDALPPQFMLYIGDLSRQKGIHLLLEAYHQLDTKIPLVLIGRPFPDVPIGRDPHVRVFGPWPHPTLMHAWNRCLFGIAPSVWHEPCATVVMEGMSQGKPMIVTNLGGMPELVTDGETGLVVPPLASAMAPAMRRLLNDADLRARMGEAALTKLSQFKASAVVRQVEAIYRTLLKV
jgi:glycosyltransferase involved in cell wall biosynthesis